MSKDKESNDISEEEDPMHCSQIYERLFAAGEHSSTLCYGPGGKRPDVPILLHALNEQGSGCLFRSVGHKPRMEAAHFRALEALVDGWIGDNLHRTHAASKNSFMCLFDGAKFSSEHAAVAHLKKDHRRELVAFLERLVDDDELMPLGNFFTKLLYADFLYPPNLAKGEMIDMKYMSTVAPPVAPYQPLRLPKKKKKKGKKKKGSAIGATVINSLSSPAYSATELHQLDRDVLKERRIVVALPPVEKKPPVVDAGPEKRPAKKAHVAPPEKPNNTKSNNKSNNKGSNKKKGGSQKSKSNQSQQQSKPKSSGNTGEAANAKESNAKPVQKTQNSKSNSTAKVKPKPKPAPKKPDPLLKYLKPANAALLDNVLGIIAREIMGEVVPSLSAKLGEREYQKRIKAWRARSEEEKERAAEELAAKQQAERMRRKDAKRLRKQVRAEATKAWQAIILSEVIQDEFKQVAEEVISEAMLEMQAAAQENIGTAEPFYPPAGDAPYGIYYPEVAPGGAVGPPMSSVPPLMASPTGYGGFQQPMIVGGAEGPANLAGLHTLMPQQQSPQQPPQQSPQSQQLPQQRPPEEQHHLPLFSGSITGPPPLDATPESMGLSSTLCVELQNLPFHVTEAEIRDFFAGLPVSRVALMTAANEKSCGFVELPTPMLVQEALQRNLQRLGSGLVFVQRPRMGTDIPMSASSSPGSLTGSLKVSAPAFRPRSLSPQENELDPALAATSTLSFLLQPEEEMPPMPEANNADHISSEIGRAFSSPNPFASAFGPPPTGESFFGHLGGGAGGLFDNVNVSTQQQPAAAAAADNSHVIDSMFGNAHHHPGGVDSSLQFLLDSEPPEAQPYGANGGGVGGIEAAPPPGFPSSPPPGLPPGLGLWNSFGTTPANTDLSTNK